MRIGAPSGHLSDANRAGRFVMAIADRAPSVAIAAAQPNWFEKNWRLIAAAAVFVAILLLLTPAGLPLAGQRMLAIFGFAVVVWVTEALDYAISAVVIAALMAVLLGISPNVANLKALYGTDQGLTMAMSGFGKGDQQNLSTEHVGP
jgi:solute carrier family 13 (sodium-dependent dicarboxylate transporter), member 2/3/5